MAYSEEDGEDVVGGHAANSLRSLELDELEIVRLKFMKRCLHCPMTVKPPRTHHCSQCMHCTVRMDHHCKWIGNCVGLHNMKQFLLFLGYSVITCIYSSLMCIYEVARCFMIDSDMCKTNELSI